MLLLWIQIGEVGQRSSCLVTPYQRRERVHVADTLCTSKITLHRMPADFTKIRGLFCVESSIFYLIDNEHVGATSFQPTWAPMALVSLKMYSPISNRGCGEKQEGRLLKEIQHREKWGAFKKKSQQEKYRVSRNVNTNNFRLEQHLLEDPGEFVFLI